MKPGAEDGDPAPSTSEKQPWSIKNLGYAWNGLRIAWRAEAGFRNHIFGAVAMVVLLVILRPEPVWWAVALLCSAFLITLELFNSCIERMVDLVDTSIRPEIKAIKDIAAAAVIVFCVTVAVVGFLMIGDTLLSPT
jgi:diacylglycerol kinase (ATP)